ncbi:MAG: hypothetical protein WD382_06445 [Halofilum sp. (in: g-proteobacteria)]
MKRLGDEYRPLLGPAIMAVTAAVLLAATWHYSAAWLAERGADFRRAQSDLTQAANRYRNASDDQEVYQEYAARFLDMRERGWVGEERRLEWIETLQGINADLRLPRLAYEIGEQVPAEGYGRDGDLELRRTPMSLDLGLLHEGDVLTLLQRLEDEGKGLMAATRCELSRAQQRVRLDAGASNIRAECGLDWYTLQIERRRDIAGAAGDGP